MAFMSGKLKVDGSLLIAPRLQDILNKVIEYDNKIKVFTCDCIDKALDKYSMFQ